MLGGGTHADKASVDQWHDLKRAARNAEWDIPPGRVGAVIRQLRYRGEEARRRASWILWLLVVVIFLGLLFYLGLPFWQQFSDGRKRTLTEQITEIDARLRTLSDEQAKAKDQLIKRLRSLPEEVLAPDGNGLSDPVQIGQAIYLVGWDRGGVWRADRDGAPFEQILPPDGNGLRDPVKIGDAIYLVGWDRGGVWRADRDGAGFEQILPPDGNGLRDPVQIGEAIYLVGWDRGGVWRAARDGAPFEQILPPDGNRLRDPVQIGEAIYLVGGRMGGVWRAARDGAPFDQIRPPDGNGLITPVQIGEAIYLAGTRDGGFWRAARDGAPFEQILPPDENGLSDPVQINEAIYLVGLREGGVWRAERDGAPFEQIRPPDGLGLSDPVQIGEAIYLVGTRDGGLLRAARDGAPFDQIRPPDGNGLITPVQIGEAIYLAGTRDGGLWRAARDGAPFEQMLPPDGNDLSKVVQIGEAIYLTGWSDGGVWRYPSSLPAEVEGFQTTEDLRNYITALPAKLQIPAIQDLAAEFTRIEIARVGLESVRSDTQARRDKFDEMPWAVLARKEAAISFEIFLAKCRAPAPGNVELSKACLSSWSQNNQQRAQSWWQTLSTQVPPGILLLFLLGTLAALYRYNMRLAGFHHSRADILELQSAGFIDERDMDALVKLVGSLSADSVSFGKMQVGFGTGSIGIEREAGKAKGE